MEQASVDTISSGKGNEEGSLAREAVPVCRCWTRWTTVLHTLIRKFVVLLSGHAARNPIPYIAGITCVSFSVLIAGFYTNFRVEVDYDVIYAPHDSRPTEHLNWMINEAEFPPGNRPFAFVVHNNGDNVLTVRGVRQLFDVLDVIQNTEGYADVCSQSGFGMMYPDGTQIEDACNIMGSTRFWYYNRSLFEESVENDSQIIQTISKDVYPDGVPVNHNYILGQQDWTNKTITNAQMFMETLLVPDVEGAKEWELVVIDNLLALQEEWNIAAEEDAGTMQMDFFTPISYEQEFQRAIYKDLPLTGMVAIIMIIFTTIVFFKPHKVQSRSLLGISSIFTITMSVFMGHGLMFLCGKLLAAAERFYGYMRMCFNMVSALTSVSLSLAYYYSTGVPYTQMVMMLPFIVYGVGLDDTFIITGAYFRTDPTKDVVKRVEEVMDNVGLSISLTTITTMMAFALGCLSSIPAIQWLCLYAFVTIGFDFLFQITVFTGFLVLDERRIEANRRDVCFCIIAKRENNDENAGDQEGYTDNESNGRYSNHHTEETKQQIQIKVEETPDLSLRFMTWYGVFLLRPVVKVAVIALFTAYFGFCAYSTTQLTQEFIISDFLPSDSYVSDYLDSVNNYATVVLPLDIYFRHLNQSDVEVQNQMRDYIEDLMELEQLDEPPPICWVRDFHEMNMSTIDVGVDLKSLSFNEKLSLAMTDPKIREVYGNDIVRAQNGDIVASRCTVYLRNIDFDIVESQINMFRDQREVTAAQPLNEGKDNWSMFTFANVYFLWEFYTIAVNELVYTTIWGIVAVAIVSFFLMPHWSAVFFVFPTICILYVDLLGTLQFAGLHINAVTYVCLTVSIGLLVDFIMHVLLRYYESQCVTREDKVKDTLKTMGISIMVGGLSTFLAVIPLAFSTSVIIRTVFTAFFSMITLGVVHGLVFLPVVLSLVGPTTTPHPRPLSLETPEETKDFAEGTNQKPPVSIIEDPNFVEIHV